MRPILLELPPPSGAAFGAACGAAVLIIGTIGIQLWRSARRAEARPIGALGGLMPALIMTAFFLWFWRGHTIRLYTYGVMLLVSFGLCWWLAVREAPRFGFLPEQVTDVGLLGLGLGVVLARSVYIGLNWSDYTKDWSQLFRLWEGGLTFHGAIAGATIAVLTYTQYHKISFWKFGDFLAPYMPLGYAIGRLGCFLNGCCHGGPTEGPFGVKFLLGQYTMGQWTEKLSSAPGGKITWPVEAVEKVAGTNMEVWSKHPLQPVQLYAAALGVAIFFLMRNLRGKWWEFDGRIGRIVACYFFFFGLERFVIEFLRRGVTGQPFAYAAFLTQAQIASLLLMLAGVIIWKWRVSLPSQVAPPEAKPRSRTTAPKPAGKERTRHAVAGSHRRGRR